MRSFRRDKDEAESEAEGFLKKLKLAKAETEETKETCIMLQGQVSKLRAAARRKVRTDDLTRFETRPNRLHYTLSYNYKS